MLVYIEFIGQFVFRLVETGAGAIDSALRGKPEQRALRKVYREAFHTVFSRHLVDSRGLLSAERRARIDALMHTEAARQIFIEYALTRHLPSALDAEFVEAGFTRPVVEAFIDALWAAIDAEAERPDDPLALWLTRRADGQPAAAPSRALEAEADAIPHPPALYSRPAYILTDQFFGRAGEIARLNAWAASDDPVMVVEAIGGMGKSALTWEWVAGHARAIMQPAGVIWWSFYERGTTIDEFLRHALAYITARHPDAPELVNLRYDQRVALLLEALAGAPYLVVLDGFERALMAYRTLAPDQIADEGLVVDRHKRECIDKRDDDFLARLRGCAPSRVLMSTRLMPFSFEGDAGEPLPGVRLERLRGLDFDDARALLQRQGVRRADSASMRALLEQVGYHPLILKVLGKAVAAPPFRGDFDRWYADVGARLNLADVALTDRRTHVLAGTAAGVSPAALRLLGCMAAFSSTVPFEALELIEHRLFTPRPEARVIPGDLPPLPRPRANPFGARAVAAMRLAAAQASDAEARARLQGQIARRIVEDALLLTLAGKDLPQRRVEIIRERQRRLREAEAEHQASAAYSDWRRALDARLGELRDWGLVQHDTATDAYDMHPVVRKFAYDRLAQADRRLANSIKDDYFSQVIARQRHAHGAARPHDVADLYPELERYHAMLFGEQIAEATDYFVVALSDKLYYEVGAYHELIRHLEPLLMRGDNAYIARMNPATTGYLRHYLALALYEVGEAEAALTLLGENLEGEIGGDSNNVGNLVATLGSYASISMSRDARKLAEAHRAFALALNIAEAAHVQERVYEVVRLQLEYAVLTGSWAEAEAAYARIRDIETPLRPWWFNTRREIDWATMQVVRGLAHTGTLNAARALVSRHNLASRRPQVEYLVGLHAYMCGDYLAARHALSEAILVARAIGRTAAATQYSALLARALIALGADDEARRMIDEVVAAATGETFYDAQRAAALADAAAALLDLGEAERARECARRAYGYAWADGPPHSRWAELRLAAHVLAALGEALPDLPPYAPEDAEPLPYEAELRALLARLRDGGAEGEPFRQTPKVQPPFYLMRIEWLHVGTIAVFGLDDQEFIMGVAGELAALSYEPGPLVVSRMGEEVPQPDTLLTDAQRRLFGELHLSAAQLRALDKFFVIAYLAGRAPNGWPNFAWVNVRADRLAALLEAGDADTPFNLADHATLVKTGGAPSETADERPLPDYDGPTEPSSELRGQLTRDYLFAEHHTNVRIFPPLDQVTGDNNRAPASPEPPAARSTELPPLPREDRPARAGQELTVVRLAGRHVGTIAFFGLDDRDFIVALGAKLARLCDVPGPLSFSRMGEDVPDLEIPLPDATPCDFAGLGLDFGQREALDKVFLITRLDIVGPDAAPGYAWVNVRGDRLEVLLDIGADGGDQPVNLAAYATLVASGPGAPPDEVRERLIRDYLFSETGTNLRSFPPLADVT